MTAPDRLSAAETLAVVRVWLVSSLSSTTSFARPKVSFHAVFIHANVRFSFGALESLLVTPRFHHWHHAAAAEARDRNFAVHLPWLDRLFGTAHFPRGEWPVRYGIAGDPVPEGYLGQLACPFRRTQNGDRPSP